MTGAASFFANWSMWGDAITAAVVSAAALSMLGVWTTLKKISYVPLALSQVSSLGVIVSFFLGERLGSAIGSGLALNPFFFSLIFALAASAYFALSKKAEESATASAYLFSAALTLILGGFVRKDLHDVDSVLFGNAVLIDKADLYFVIAASVAAFGAQFIVYKRLLFSSFDERGAGASGVPYFASQAIFYASLAAAVSAATKALGALPAFGFTVFPALTALAFGMRMKTTFAVAVAAGATTSFLGFYVSFIYELPTGACMTAAAGIFFAIAKLYRAAIDFKKRRMKEIS